MTIDVSIYTQLTAGKRRFTLDVAFQSRARRIVLFGPSGAGKSITLRAVAGLLRPDAGRIVIDARVLFDSDAAVWVPPRLRNMAYLFQDCALFPHLSVAQNIAFGLDGGWRNPAGRKSPLPELARRWVEAFELQAILGNTPAEISGGQRQRVALARALASQPGMLLLDEPFAALDATLRKKMRAELNVLLAELDVPMLLITHDPADVDVLADEVLLMLDGKAGAATSLDDEIFVGADSI
jgi:molybdate transport system ATP-binding protein